MPVSAFGTGFDSGMKGLADLFTRLARKFDSDEYKAPANPSSANGSLDPLSDDLGSLDKLASYIGKLKYYGSGAPLQNEFTKMMSDTEMQRARADLEAAGYNPLMAIGSGGASSPSSASGTSNGSMLPALLSGIARIVGTSIHAASNDNKTLTMANSAASINTAKIAADAARKAAQAEYYQNKAKDTSKSEVNRAMAEYYNRMSDSEKVHYDSKNKKWIDDYWKNFKE